MIVKVVSVLAVTAILWWITAAVITGEIKPTAAQEALNHGAGGILHYIPTIIGLVGIFVAVPVVTN